MVLDEPTDSFRKYESNGISAYMEPELYEHLSGVGDINIDYVESPYGEGYRITVGDENNQSDSCGW